MGALYLKTPHLASVIFKRADRFTLLQVPQSERLVSRARYHLITWWRTGKEEMRQARHRPVSRGGHEQYHRIACI
jgi:hypothetical protein